MPSLGHEGYFETAVNSVLAARPTQADFEFRILDAGSSEPVRARMAKMIRGIDGARLECRPDRGQADALRRCFADTDADVLGWLNTDDVILPGALDRVLARFAADDTVDVVYGEGLFIDERGRVKGAYPVARFDAELLKSFCYLSQPSTFFRGAAYERAGGIDARLRFAMDYDLWLRLLKTGARFERIRGFLSATRLHEHTKTATGRQRFTAEVVAAQHNAFPDQATAERAAWQAYRRRVERGLPRPGALVRAVLRGGNARDLPRRLRWAAKVAGLHGMARLRSSRMRRPQHHMRLNPMTHETRPRT
jgi:hypothetical protein